MTKWEVMILERIQNVNNFSKMLEGKRWGDSKKGDDEEDEVRLNQLGQEGWQLFHIEKAYDVTFLGKGFSHLTSYYLRRQVGN